MVLRKSSRIAATIIIFILGQITQISTDAQSHRRSSREDETRASLESDSTDYSMDWVCQNLALDSLGTTPIDEMAAEESLPVTDHRVVAGRQRAERLLPIAKRLLPVALKRLMLTYHENTSDLARITARVSTIDTIKPDIAAHDNALVGGRNPREIIFGTVFLAGLRSDEAMIAVLAHELSHVVNGSDQVLQNLFLRIQRQASNLGRISIQHSQGIELGCDLAGIYVLQDYIAQTGSKEPKPQRMARAFQKNCVTKDLADATHLSPRTTLRLLFMLEPNATGIIEGKQVAPSMQSRKVFDRSAIMQKRNQR